MKRFLDRLVSMPNGCTEYRGTQMPNGYRKLGRDGKTYLAHRFAWERWVGPIPDGLCVLHRCDNRSCVRIAHLFLGTPQDNTNDMMRKGRGRFVGFLSPKCREAILRSVKRGDEHVRTKIADADVALLLRLSGDGWKQTDLARRFGICQAHVSRIVRREVRAA